MSFRPANKEELFNLQHVQARNVIECIFGVLKRRFRILIIPPEYSVKVQAQIPSALCAIHNFIQIYDPKEDELPDLRHPEYSNSIPNPGDNGVQQINYGEDDVLDDVAVRRDKIAQDMWDSYQAILEGRREDEGGDDSDNDSEGNLHEQDFQDDDTTSM